MKIQLFALALLGCLSSFQAEMTKEEIKKLTQGMLKECATEAKASDADIDAFNSKKMPASHEGLCMIECFLDKVGIMNEGKYDKEGLVGALSTVIKDEAKLKKLNELADFCDKKIGKGVADKCENAKSTITCLVVDGKTHGFDFADSALG